MTSTRHRPPRVTAFADHEVITPPDPLRRAWSRSAPDEVDPVARAEQALAKLSTEFSSWMDGECARLDSMRAQVHADFTESARNALFSVAHDIKGEAETFGFPLAVGAAASLSLLLERAPDPRRIPLTLVDQHVDAVRAIVREHARSDAAVKAAELTRELEKLTREFLVAEGADGLDDAGDAA